jgi:hypothetical protein
MSRALLGLASAVVAAALTAGCGGDDATEAGEPDAANIPAIVGTLTYRLADGVAHEMAKPVHGTCVTFEGAAMSIDNATDATAHLRDGCDGPEGDVIIPQATWQDGEGPPATAVVMLRH